MKTVVVMQPYFFPYLGYFQLAASSSVFVFLDDVAFIKQGWINRNRWLVQGKAHLFTVPLVAPSINRSIATTLIVDNLQWRSKLIRQLEQAYARAPFRAPVIDLVRSVLSSPHRSISTLAAASVRASCSYVGLHVSWKSSSDSFPLHELKGASRIISICRELEANRYINAPGGKELYDTTKFAKAGIELKFLKPVLPTYSQLGNSFVSGLSIIDVLMFNPPETVRSWMEAYELE